MAPRPEKNITESVCKNNEEFEINKIKNWTKDIIMLSKFGKHLTFKIYMLHLKNIILADVFEEGMFKNV